jgi:hypothetical protein
MAIPAKSWAFRIHRLCMSLPGLPDLRAGKLLTGAELFRETREQKRGCS